MSTNFGDILLQGALNAVPPIGIPIQVFRAVTGGSDGQAAREGQKATLGGKPVVYNSRTRKWDPDLSTETGKNAWRKPGSTSVLGGSPVTWDPQRGWTPTGGAGRSNEDALPPPPPADTNTWQGIDSSVEAPPVPNLPPPQPATFPESKDSPLETQKPDLNPRDVFDYQERILSNFFLPLRREEQARELERSIVTARLRDRGLKELSRRAIEQENIRAWRDLEVARQQAMSNQAIALANTAYLSQIPNTGFMQAMAETMKASTQPVTIRDVGGVG
jgi:hypothetical protein